MSPPEVDASKFSFSLSSRGPPKPTSSARGAVTNATKRPRARLMDDDDDDDDAHEGKAIPITTLGPATEQGQKTPPRVIAPLANKDWRGDGQRKRQRSELPGKAGQGGSTANDEADKINAGEKKYGLQIVSRARSQSPSTQDDNKLKDGTRTPTGEEQASVETRTLEDEALAQLQGEEPSMANSHTIAPVALGDEDAAFRRDYTDAPAEPTLNDYNQTPVDGFGAALLRGYLKPGQSLEKWKEGQEAKIRKNQKGKATEGIEKRRGGRRPEFLGMGAREMNISGEEKSGNKGFRRRPEQEDYVPLARVNRVTGEMLSEAEFQQRLEKQAEEDKKEKVITNGDTEGEGKEKKRLENGDRQRDSSDRADLRRDRRRDDDDYYERRERRRRDDERDHNSGRDRDRHRHRHERYDDRSDSERDRKRRERRDDYYDSRSERRHGDRSRESHRHRR